MKTFLMYRQKDFSLDGALSPNSPDLIQDLALEPIFQAMANGDPFLLEVSKAALLSSMTSADDILYRQRILIDCLAYPSIIREIYGISVQAIEREKKVWGWMSSRYPSGTLYRGVEVLEVFSALLKKLRQIAIENASGFRSDGFRRLFDMIGRELDQQYLNVVEEHLKRLKFPRGIVMTAELGPRNKGTNYVLRKQSDEHGGWWERTQYWLEQIMGRNGSRLFYEIAERDQAGSNALSELRDEGIRHVAAALAESADHILSFFSTLRLELGFYLACLNLRDHLLTNGGPVSLPEPVPSGPAVICAQGIYDPSLSLTASARVVGNDVVANGKTLIIVTGANRGGKSTLLRSLGVAQLMMQAGMFVAARSFRADIRMNVFTHFKREEDASMKSGKLDEELRRMTNIVDLLTPNSIVFFNESFASTNEREGSEIARQIVQGMLDAGVKVVYVSHMYDLTYGFYSLNLTDALFLRAERLPDGQRTFRVSEGEPLPTSHGEDLYNQIFCEEQEQGANP